MKRTYPFVLALLVAAFPGVAQAQQSRFDRDHSARLDAYLVLGFGGEAQIDTDFPGFSADFEPDPTVGFGMRGEAAVLDFLSIGGMFEAAKYEIDLPSPLRDFSRWILDFDLLLRLRWVFEVIRNDFFLEPYLAVPVGFSLGILPDIDSADPDDDEPWPGWNIGAMAGLSFISGSGFGGFVEAGYRHHDVRSAAEVPIAGNVDASFKTHQFALNLGLLFTF